MENGEAKGVEMPRIRRRWILGLTCGLACGVFLPATSFADPPRPAAAEARSWEARGEAYAHLMRSLFAARRGEFRVAESEVRKAVALLPDSAEVRVQGAALLQRMGRIGDAEELARDALKLDARHAEALELLAGILAARTLAGPRPDPAARDEALELYGRLLEQDPENEQVLRGTAGLMMQADDRAGALKIARRLVELRPGDRRATGSLAQLLLDEGREFEALETVLAYVVDHPFDTGLIGLADELTRRFNAWQLVARVFGEREAYGELIVPAQRLRGEALLQLGRVEEAAEALEKGARADPGDRELRFRLAAAYRTLGRYADSTALIRQLTDEDATDGRAYFLLAEMLEVQGADDEALNAFNTALRLFAAEGGLDSGPILDMIRRRMTVVYLSQDRVRAAGRMLEELKTPESPEALELRARIAITDRDWTEARRVTRQLRQSGEPGVAALLEGEINAQTGRWAKAQPKFDEAIAELGQRTAERIAEVYHELGRAELAEEVLRAWVAAEPRHPDAQFYLGYLLFRLDRFDDAEVALRAAFELDPAHAPALNFLGYSLAENNVRLDEALELIERALEVDAWNGAYLDSLGWVYYQLGRYAEARDPLERAAREYPNDPTVLEHLGDLYRQLGEQQLALAAWYRALEAGPDDRDALEAKIASERAHLADRQALGGPATTDPGENRRDPGAPPMRP
jgi:tetratricopeptide (TPR) repeat protein